MKKGYSHHTYHVWKHKTNRPHHFKLGKFERKNFPNWKLYKNL